MQTVRHTALFEILLYRKWWCRYSWCISSINLYTRPASRFVNILSINHNNRGFFETYSSYLRGLIPWFGIGRWTRFSETVHLSIAINPIANLWNIAWATTGPNGFNYPPPSRGGIADQSATTCCFSNKAHHSIFLLSLLLGIANSCYSPTTTTIITTSLRFVCQPVDGR